MTTIREAFKAIIPIVERLATYPSSIKDEMNVDSMRTVAREALGIIRTVPQNEIDFEIDQGLKQAMQGSVAMLDEVLVMSADDRITILGVIGWLQGAAQGDRPNITRGEAAAALQRILSVPWKMVDSMTDEQKQLCEFYSVTTLAELVAIQATHIDRLQKRLPKTEVPNYRSPREG